MGAISFCAKDATVSRSCRPAVEDPEVAPVSGQLGSVSIVLVETHLELVLCQSCEVRCIAGVGASDGNPTSQALWGRGH